MPAEHVGWDRLLDALPAAVIWVDQECQPRWSNAMARSLAGVDDPAGAVKAMLDLPEPAPGDPSQSLGDALAGALEGEHRREPGVRLQTTRGVVQRDLWLAPVSGPDGTIHGAVALLSAEEERLHVLLEHTTDVIAVLEPDGAIRYANPAAARLTGYQGEVMSGRSAVDLLHPDDVPLALELLAQRVEHPGTRMEPAELRVRHGDGGWRHMVVNGENLIDDPAVHGLVITLHDITERKVAERRFQALVEDLSDVIVLVSEDLTVSYVSPAIERIIGEPATEAVGGYALGDIHPDDLGTVLDVFEDLRAEPGAQRHFEMRLRRLTEEDHWRRVEVTATNRLQDPAIGGVVVSMRDVTELRLAEARFRDLIELVPDAMVLSDETGRIVLVNAQTERLLGYERDELVGQSIEVLVPEALRERHRGHRASFVADPRVREMGAGLDLFARRRDGTDLPVEISLAPLETEHGTLVSAAIRDVTERRLAQDALQAAYDHEREAAEQLRKVDEMKDEFLATASHELRTPLTVVAGFSRLLIGGGSALTGEERDMYLSRIVANIDNMVSMVEQLLDHSRLAAGRAVLHPAPLRLAPVVHHVLDTCSDRLSEHRVDVDVPDDLTALADEDGVGHILRNLVTNAAKFSPPGTAVHVTAGVVEVEGSSAMAELRVTDEGPGISPEEQEQIFERFQQASPTAPASLRGSGLGLSIARRYAELQDGTIGLDSEPGAGSSFFVRLPLPTAAPRSEQP
jgi:PAS domain S-box-containing protein